MIHFDRVGKSFGNHTILQNISLHIERGELVTLIGRSGSGKTTLLRLINGLEKATSGEISVLGQSLSSADLVRLRRKIGYVIQENGLFPHLTVFDNIAYVLNLQREPKSLIRPRVAELLNLLELPSELARKYPHQLSGGQKQRVGIARALAAKPDIVLMDEPFSALDELTRANLQQQIKQLWQTLGTTIIFITHDIQEALQLGSKVLVLEQGTISQYASPDILLAEPATPFIASLTRGK
ncbi:ABC transporter ATP-binding protein [Pasteurellaceae bacterium LIM206]|nr:ABC transporter ATP-binding protein [Pasteurellaceae bacterium LIM206]